MNIRDDYVLKNIDDGYLVGGAVRDFLTGKPVNDRDIAVFNAKEVADKLAKQFDAVFVPLDLENNIYRLVLKNHDYIDVSEIRAETIEEDLKKRDFTINAIAYDLKNRCFIDVTGGLEDLKNKKLRSISEENFIDDPLRILRAFRFYATTGFTPDEELISVLKKYYKLIEKPAKERVQYELMKMFGGDYTHKALLLMDEIGILEYIFPCTAEMKKIPPNSHHHLGLLYHSIETVKQIDLIYKDLPGQAKQSLNSISFGDFPRLNTLKISALLHDIGKFSTWTIEEGGRHRFIKHDIIGSKLVVPLLKNLKFSNKQTEYIATMIQKHIYPSSVISSPNQDNKVLMRYVRKIGKWGVDNIVLAMADRKSALGPEVTEEMVESNISGLNSLLKFYLNNKHLLNPLPKLLDGNEIMNIKGIKQTPELGKIINALKEAQISGDITDTESAIEFVKNFEL